MASSSEPKLAAPGAGLPALELAIARMSFARRRKSWSRERFNEQFGVERAAIRRRVDGCEPSLRRRRVLIRRLRGLEDSSRNWSLWMTLEHLRICNEAFARFITLLGRDETPEGRVSTADVKPSPEVGGEVEDGFEASCEAVLEAVESVPELATRAAHPHPWFGPLDAAGWHALAALHMGIHRVQIERIAAGLEQEGGS